MCDTFDILHSNEHSISINTAIKIKMDSFAFMLTSSFSFLFQPPQMGSMTMTTQPTMMYTQPVMRPANPFGPVSGAQV